MTEKEKMLSGMVYSAVDDELLKELNEVKEIIHEYNNLMPSATEERFNILKALLGHTEDDDFIINQPFYCDYGSRFGAVRTAGARPLHRLASRERRHRRQMLHGLAPSARP